MKAKIAILFLLFTFGSNVVFGRSGSEGYLEFYKAHKSHEDVINLDIPTFFARFFLHGEDRKELRSLLRKIDDFKIFVADRLAYELLPILNESLKKASYIDAMIVKDEGEIITFKTKGNDTLITEIILVVDQVDSFVVVSVMGKFTPEDMRKYVRAIDTQKMYSGD
ncbi:MAG: DUF4252 domain-containing protein [Bacteroidales bacterium]|nr:DUF4252 domain-containing protein [Bacteroidales bacterium]